CDHTAQCGETLQPHVRVPQMKPPAQKQIVKRHVAFAPPEGAQKPGPRLPGYQNAEAFGGPKAPGAKHMKTQVSSHGYHHRDQQACLYLSSRTEMSCRK